MTTYRPKDFVRITAAMHVRLEGHGLLTAQKAALIRIARGSEVDAGVSWGSAKQVVTDILRIINDRRLRDGRPRMDEEGLRHAVRAMLRGSRKEPAVEELSDALANLREIRLGVRKMPPLHEDLKRIA
jgi:hypothetical protein